MDMDFNKFQERMKDREAWKRPSCWERLKVKGEGGNRG